VKEQKTNEKQPEASEPFTPVQFTFSYQESIMESLLQKKA